MTHTWIDTVKPSNTVWTDIAKPSLLSGSMVTTTVGVPIGLLLALTYSVTSSVVTSTSWTDIAKPSNTVWTDIVKAT